MPYLSITLLGGFEVTLDAEPVTGFVTNKDRALLAFLALEAFHPHRRAELAAMFWPDASEKKAAHSLSQGLLHLRKALGGNGSTQLPFLLITSQDVQFNGFSDYHLDVARLRELVNLSDRHIHADPAGCEICRKWLQEAVNLYRGDLLAGLFLPNCEKFEEWRLVQQEELHHEALEILDRLAVSSEQRSEWELVQEYSRRQIALESWRETAHYRLMRALVQNGQHSAALKQYDTYCKILSDELGLEPAGEIRKYSEQVRSGEKAPSAQPSTAESLWLPGQGERRQVTTLVCSRNILAELEEGPELELACERYCEPIFKRFGGRRAPRQGAACLVYFGYPQAFEDAARRAVHSGLAMALPQEGQEPARIGIHTGLTLVGEGRTPRWQDRDLSGLSLDIARDCQRWAQSGQVLITEDTHHLVQGAFRFEELPIVLPAEPGKSLAVYRVQEESSLQSRLDWLAETQRLTTYTGREKELNQLETCHKKLLQGKGRIVLVRGDPGIGKSRLVWELKKRLDNRQASQVNFGDHRPVLWLESHCLPHYQNTNLYPIVSLMEQLIGIQPEDGQDIRREKLKGVLAWYGMNRPATLWLLSTLLGLQTEASALQTVSSVQREQMRQACLELIGKRAVEQPLVLLVEDLHWSDPSTVDWIEKSFRSLAEAPSLVLLTARPGFTTAWPARHDPGTDLLQLELSPLAQQQVEDMVSGLVGDTRLDHGMYRHIVAHTDGIPLYIEELAKALLERPAQRSNLVIGSKEAVPGIPATLQDSLAARLDTLGTAKETAQWAAVLGREFDLSVLQVCVPYDEPRLQEDLARLIQAELITPVGTSIQESIPVLLVKQTGRKRAHKAPVRYSFKHALLQDAIYDSLLKRTRREYHLQIAERLQAQFPGLSKSQPEVVAQHYAQAGMFTHAADLWLQAGQQATTQGATMEARTFFDLVLEHVEPTDLERRWTALMGREHVFDLRVDRDAQKKDIDMLLELAGAFDEVRRLQALQLEIDYAIRRRVDFQLALQVAEEAISVAHSIGNIAFEVSALAGKLQLLFDNGVRVTARDIVEEILAKLPGVKDSAVHAYALGKVSLYYIHEGDSFRAVQLMQEVVQAARQAGDRFLETRSLYNMAFAYVQMGLYEQALAISNEVMKLAESRGDEQMTSFTSNLSYLYWCLGNREQAIALGEQILRKLRVSDENPYNKAGCLAYLGYFLESAGEWQKAAAYLREAQEIFTQIGDKSVRLEQQVVEARCLAALGRLEEARQLAGDGWFYIREHGKVGMEIPSRVYRCVADVVTLVEVPGISSVREVIEAGYWDLMEQAGKISNVDWRKSFLENVAENRTIVQRWQMLNQNNLSD
ncbi:MAG: AAA family ATPase [Bacteroidota bacterium]